MLLDDYQENAAKYQLNTPPEERILGLLEEAGEVAGVLKRFVRGDYNGDVCVTKLHKELGDVLWYLSRVAADNGFKLSEIAEANLEKLESRKIRNMIMGAGDDR